MTRSRVAVVGRLRQFSRKRLKVQRRLYWGLNILSPTADLRMLTIKRCKHFEPGGDKRKGQVMQF
ncbi:unnamed protein product [Gulo gulo]|uniref:Uncharacterized protein n=1 Tax=Gulo gulo TaxID=48420 RepID=A0A9X9LSD1_GULGU|nr:unnamed protein product [Gulo gulo]